MVMKPYNLKPGEALPSPTIHECVQATPKSTGALRRPLRCSVYVHERLLAHGIMAEKLKKQNIQSHCIQAEKLKKQVSHCSTGFLRLLAHGSRMAIAATRLMDIGRGASDMHPATSVIHSPANRAWSHAAMHSALGMRSCRHSADGIVRCLIDMVMKPYNLKPGVQGPMAL